jgi:ankyrin repeat protein
MQSRLTVYALTLANADAFEIKNARTAQTDALLARVALLGHQQELRSEASKGNDLRIKKLLALRIDPNAVDARGQATLHLAASMGHLGTVRPLLDNNADPSQLDGSSPGLMPTVLTSLRLKRCLANC